MAEIHLRNVSKRWGSFVGVKSFDLQIADAEFLVLLGPSGCGKTTTMRMIAGLEDATEGEIAIGGRVVNDLSPKDRDIAMVFQSYGLYPTMTVYENIRFPLKVRKVPQAQHHEMVMRAAEMVELTDFLDRKPAALSGGQRQRVALARAIVRKPTVFLMDEPLSNLDAKLRVSTRAQIKNLHHELRTTTIYVTHDQIEAMTLADRVVVMNKGEVQQVGAPIEIYDRPANTFVAGFIGSPAMNLMEGTMTAGVFEGRNVRIPGFTAVRDGAASSWASGPRTPPSRRRARSPRRSIRWSFWATAPWPRCRRAARSSRSRRPRTSPPPSARPSRPPSPPPSATSSTRPRAAASRDTDDPPRPRYHTPPAARPRSTSSTGWKPRSARASNDMAVHFHEDFLWRGNRGCGTSAGSPNSAPTGNSPSAPPSPTAPT
jgi:multiple sugar transport system ATP-binding protein